MTSANSGTLSTQPVRPLRYHLRKTQRSSRWYRPKGSTRRHDRQRRQGRSRSARRCAKWVGFTKTLERCYVEIRQWGRACIAIMRRALAVGRSHVVNWIHASGNGIAWLQRGASKIDGCIKCQSGLFEIVVGCYPLRGFMGYFSILGLVVEILAKGCKLRVFFGKL